MNILNKYKNKYKKLSAPVKASFWFLICSFLQKGISVITTPIFTRLLTTEEYGKYNVFTSWESIIIVIATMNLFYGVYSQGLVKYEDDKEKFSSSMQGLTLLIITIWFIIYLIFHNFFNNIFSLPTNYVILMFIWMWTTAIFQFWASEQRVDFKYKKLVMITLVYSILSPTLSILLINFMEDNVLARILGMVIASILIYGWMFFSQVFRGKILYSKKYWKHALSFNLPLVPHYLSQTVLSSSDRIMIEKMVGASEAGIYSLAYSLSSIMTLFNNALSQTISPWMYKKIKNNQVQDISKIAYSTLILIASVNILLILFAPEIIAIFAPSSYYEAIWVIPPVAMSVYFMYSYDLFAKFEFYYEKTKLIATATFVGAVLNIILNYICIKLFGYVAAAYTTLFCYILYSLFHYIFMNKVCKENNIQSPYNTKILLVITIVFLAFGFILMALYNYTIIRYIFILIIFIIAIIKKKFIIDNVKKLILLKKEKN